MSDINSGATPPAGSDGPDLSDPDKSWIQSRGKGMSLENALASDKASAALKDFQDLVARHKAAEAEAEELKSERNASIRTLKDDYNVGFSALAEVIGATSSLVLYLYERAAGKSAKQIREESQKSAAAKAAFRETDPNAAPARKQTPEEKSFRKQQRDALKAFLASQRADNPEITDSEVAPDDAEG